MTRKRSPLRKSVQANGTGFVGVVIGAVRLQRIQKLVTLQDGSRADASANGCAFQRFGRHRLVKGQVRKS